jgi:hypothetical protein
MSNYVDLLDLQKIMTHVTTKHIGDTIGERAGVNMMHKGGGKEQMKLSGRRESWEVHPCHAFGLSGTMCYVVEGGMEGGRGVESPFMLEKNVILWSINSYTRRLSMSCYLYELLLYVWTTIKELNQCGIDVCCETDQY